MGTLYTKQVTDDRSGSTKGKANQLNENSVCYISLIPCMQVSMKGYSFITNRQSILNKVSVYVYKSE